jgi:nitroimidazol reductase NimA-like FMN-containing flavoprotein (pyridoxamine 5'-phosphate oxidase superfamily)
MAANEPVAARPFIAGEQRPLPSWPEVRRRLAEGGTYWLATVRPDGRPHVVPVLAVWLDGALHFSSSPSARKAKNLASSPHCALTLAGPALDLVVEGEATKVRDDATLHRLAEAYATKYQWQVAVRDGAFFGDGAPTAGPPPYEVYELTPAAAFSFGTDATFGAACWRFLTSQQRRRSPGRQ